MAKAEPKAAHRLPKDFNHMKPDDLQITDPERAEHEAAGIPVDREFPKHLHKFVGVGLVHEYVEVTDSKGEAKARRDGYLSPQEANALLHEAEAALADDAGKSAKKAKN